MLYVDINYSNGPKVAINITFFRLACSVVAVKKQTKKKTHVLPRLMITHRLKDNRMLSFSVVIFGVAVLGCYDRNVRPINASPTAKEAPSHKEAPDDALQVIPT